MKKTLAILAVGASLALTLILPAQEVPSPAPKRTDITYGKFTLSNLPTGNFTTNQLYTNIIAQLPNWYQGQVVTVTVMLTNLSAAGGLHAYFDVTHDGTNWTTGGRAGQLTWPYRQTNTVARSEYGNKTAIPFTFTNTGFAAIKLSRISTEDSGTGKVQRVELSWPSAKP